MAPTKTDLANRARALQGQLSGWRRAIHRWPELSFTEERTAKLIQGTLEELAIPYTPGVAKTGVVGTIEGDPKGPVVGLRADMDALPIFERNESGFDSERPGIMHACGHDAHTAMLLGAATLLRAAAERGELPGSVRLLFQPSEESSDSEGKSGGLRMVEEGALEGVDGLFGLHVESALKVGSARTRPGPMLAAVDTFGLTLRVPGGHATEPHKTPDPIALSGLIINAIHQIVSRRLDPVEHGLITIGTISAGTATNIIPDRLTMTGTVRSLTAAGRTRLREELRKICSVVEPLGAQVELKFQDGYPVTVNDPEATEFAFDVMRELLGDDQVSESPLILGSEDFSYLSQAVPGCFIMLGVKSPLWDREYPVHTPTFRLDEAALPTGTSLLAGLALSWLERAKG